jgi:hypothetical protein
VKPENGFIPGRFCFVALKEVLVPACPREAAQCVRKGLSIGAAGGEEAYAYTGEAVRSLAAIMRKADAPPRARLRAIDILLDRGWGKPPQAHADKDCRDVRVVIRKIVSD